MHLDDVAHKRAGLFLLDLSLGQERNVNSLHILLHGEQMHHFAILLFLAMPKLDNDCDDCNNRLAVGFCAKVTTSQDQINACCDALFHWDKNGNARVHVCAFCGKLWMHQDDVEWLLVKTLVKSNFRKMKRMEHPKWKWNTHTTIQMI